MTVKSSIQAEELANKARELKGLIDDSESVIFINLDRYTCTKSVLYVVTLGNVTYSFSVLSLLLQPS